MASLEFSEVVDGYEELLSDHTFYSKVRVTYNGGAKTTEVNNALVCADSSTLALGMRINSGEVDNIVISEYEDPITSIELDSSAKTDYLVGDKFGGANLLITYETGATKKVAVSEDMLNGFDTATAGEKTVKIAYGETELEYVIHVTEPAPVTEEPVVTAAPTAAPEKQDDTTEKSNKKALTVGLIAGGVLILAIAAVLIILNAKKKK